jgi:hypothetical protein
VISTSVLVLPGARGHAEVSRKAQPTPYDRNIRQSESLSYEACSPIPLSCDGFCSNAGTFTRSVESRNRSNLQRRPHLTDLARLTGLKFLSGQRVYPCLTWLRCRSRRHLQEPSPVMIPACVGTGTVTGGRTLADTPPSKFLMTSHPVNRTRIMKTKPPDPCFVFMSRGRNMNPGMITSPTGCGHGSPRQRRTRQRYPDWPCPVGAGRA